MNYRPRIYYTETASTQCPDSSCPAYQYDQRLAELQAFFISVPAQARRLRRPRQGQERAIETGRLSRSPDAPPSGGNWLRAEKWTSLFAPER